MKKIIHKLKKNRLVSKIAALLTICMILVSSFTVSSFAADEEEATNSITDVWTGVTDSIMSLLGTAQGVFYYEELGSFDFAAYGDSISSSFFGPIYRVEGIPVFTSPVGFAGNITLGNITLPATFEFAFEDDLLIGVVTYNNAEQFLAIYDPNGFYSGVSPGWYMLEGDAMINNQFVTYTFVPSASGFELTFLGTLAAVAVAIALIMLLVYVISRFLRLRG